MGGGILLDSPHIAIIGRSTVGITARNGDFFLANLSLMSSTGECDPDYSETIRFRVNNKSYYAAMPNMYSWTSNKTVAMVEDIPSFSEYASISYVDNSISALSSVYAPLSDYASQAWVSSNFLSSGYVPTISGYAELSASNIFTNSNKFTARVTFSSANASITMDKADIYLNAQNGTYNGGHLYFNNVNTYIWKSAAASYPLQIQASGGIRIVNTNAYSINIQNSQSYIRFSDIYSSFTLSEIALKTELPVLSEYATISALSSAIDSLSSVYAPIGNYASQADITALSSVYAPINYLPSGVSGYTSEVFTFTLSDNTTVSKTILVG